MSEPEAAWGDLPNSTRCTSAKWQLPRLAAQHELAILETRDLAPSICSSSDGHDNGLCPNRRRLGPSARRAGAPE